MGGAPGCTGFPQHPARTDRSPITGSSSSSSGFCADWNAIPARSRGFTCQNSAAFQSPLPGHSPRGVGCGGGGRKPPLGRAGRRRREFGVPEAGGVTPLRRAPWSCPLPAASAALEQVACEAKTRAPKVPRQPRARLRPRPANHFITVPFHNRRQRWRGFWLGEAKGGVGWAGAGSPSRPPPWDRHREQSQETSQPARDSEEPRAQLDRPLRIN